MALEDTLEEMQYTDPVRYDEFIAEGLMAEQEERLENGCN